MLNILRVTALAAGAGILGTVLLNLIAIVVIADHLPDLPEDIETSAKRDWE